MDMPDLSTRAVRSESAVLARLAEIFSLWFAVAVLYWPSSMALDGLWRGDAGEAYTHGYVVLLVSLWLIVRDRAALAETPVLPAPRASLLLVLLSLLWLWSWRSAIQVLHVALVPCVLLAAIAVALGWRMARRLAFPVGFLYFAMPLWTFVNGTLQSLSAKANGALVAITGISAYMQGDYIHVPAGSIEIAGACSGLHAFIVGLALAALYGELQKDPLRRRVVWLGLMGALALLVNYVRIYAVTFAAYKWGLHAHLVAHHYWLGWYLFTAAFLGFLWLAGRLGSAWDRAGSRAMPQRMPEASPRRAVAGHTGRAGLAVALAGLGVLPAASYAADLARSLDAASIVVEWPAAPPGWSGPQPVAASEWAPEFVRPSARSMRRYVEAGAGAVEIFEVAYRTQTQRAKLLDYYNDLLGNPDLLRPLADHVVDSPRGRWRETLAVDAAGTRSLVWSRYRIGNRRFVRRRLSQLWYGVAALAGSPVSSLTALRAVCAPSCGAARTRLASAMALRPDLRLEAHTDEERAP